MAHIGSPVLHVVLAVLPEEVVASDGFPEQTAVVLLFAHGIVLARWCHSQSAKFVFNRKRIAFHEVVRKTSSYLTVENYHL